MFCRYCGKKVLEDSMFCMYCGKKLIAEPQTESQQDSLESADTTPAFVPASTPEVTYDEPKSIPEAAYEPKPTPETTYEPKPIPEATYEPKPIPEPTYEPKPTPEATDEPKPTPKVDAEFKTDPEFVWDLHEFPESKKTEDIVFEWQKALKNTQELKAQELAEAKANVNANEEGSKFDPLPELAFQEAKFRELLEKLEIKPSFLEDLKTETSDPVAEMDAFESIGIFETKRSQKEAFVIPIADAVEKLENDSSEVEIEKSETFEPEHEITVTIDDIKKELDLTKAESSYDEKIDKFYTFNKKNEEFQKLLDREYERTRAKESDTLDIETELETKAEEIQAEEIQAEEIQTETEASSILADELKTEAEELQAELDAVSAQMEAFKASIRMRPVDPEFEINKLSQEQSAEEAKQEQSAEEVEQNQSTEAEQEQSTEEAETETETETVSAPMPIPETSKLIYDNETLARKFDTKAFNADLIELALEKAGIEIDQEDFDESEFEEENSSKFAEKPEPLEKYESDFKPKFITETEQEEDQWEETEHSFDTDDDLDEAVMTDPQKQQAFKELEQLWGVDDSDEKKVKKDDFFLREGEEENDDEHETKKGKASTIIIAALVILLAVQSSILGVIHFAPESRAADFVNRELGFAINWFTNLTESDERDPNGENGLDTRPEENKTLLIEGQLHHNTGIGAITANEQLGLNPNINYFDQRISESVPIENNIWRMSDDVVRFIDREVVATIIRFNSRWVNYVNAGDPRILELVTAGSPMEQSLLAFTGFGETTYTFSELEIGEIRQFQDRFFIWTHEVITAEETEQALVRRERSRIYELEIRDENMYIVTYFPAQ